MEIVGELRNVSLFWGVVFPVLVFVLALVLETILRELRAPAVLRPLHWVRRLGDGVKRCYYLAGLGLGWCWFVCCAVSRFVADRLWRAVRETLLDLLRALTPYFQVCEVWRGMKAVAWEYWLRWKRRIKIGAVMIAGASMVPVGALVYRSPYYTGLLRVVPVLLLAFVFAGILSVGGVEAATMYDERRRSPIEDPEEHAD
jgi:hypothetical protein